MPTKTMFILQCFKSNRSDKSETNRVNMVTKRTQCKWYLRKAKYDNDKKETKKSCCMLNTKNVRLYWNMFKKCAGVKGSNIPIDVLNIFF